MTKFSFILVTIVALLASTILTQDCLNPLLGIYGLPSLENFQLGEGLPYCANLQGGSTCCSAETVATFQDRLNGLVANLNEDAVGRDLYLAQLRNSYFDRFRDILEDINDDHANELRAIRQGNAGVADQLQEIIDEATQINTDGRTINNQFVKSLDEYQRARSDCLTAALQVQSSSWCLACDPNYAVQGVSADGNVLFSDALCQSLSDACTPFFTQGAAFNPLVRARELYWRLTAVARYLNDYSRNNNVINEFVVPEDPYNPLPSQEGVTIPDPAANTGACQNLWAGNANLRQLLTIGATVPSLPENNAARLLQNSLAGDGGVWAPELNTTGLDFGGLRLDPGDFFGASDYSDYFNQNQNASDLTDNNDDDRTDHDIFDRSD